MEISETPLPGVGVRFDFTTREGQQLSVINHHTGRRSLVAYDRHDPDAARELISLDDEEADTLSELLGAPRITGALADLQHRIEGLAIDWMDIKPSSPFVNRLLGDTHARSRTGVSIVAVVRKDKPFPAPAPDFVFQAGDVAVVVGTPDGIKALQEILNG